MDRLDGFQQFVGPMLAQMNHMRSIWNPRGIAALLLAMSSLARAEVFNNGESGENLIKLSNKNGFGTSQLDLTPQVVNGNGVLAASMAGTPGDFSSRSVWYAPTPGPTNRTYSVSAKFLPQAAETEYRGGVMGWLDVASSKGIALFVVPGGPAASFRVATVDFNAESGFDNESAVGLFGLNGSAATPSVGSSWIELGEYAPTEFATFELQFSQPTSADLQATTNATAKVTARVYQGADPSGKPIQIGATIELLTELPFPVPANHRVGYYAYNGSIFADPGPVGLLDDLSGAGDFSKANKPPTVSLLSPADGTTLTAPGTVRLEAAAADSDGSIKRIEYYSGATLVGTAEAPPFWIQLMALPAGSYTFSAKAFDDLGSVASTGPVRVTVNEFIPPGGDGSILSFTLAGTKLTVSWPATSKGQVLQSSTSLLNPVWTDVAGSAQATSIVADLDGVARFYRLIKGGTDPGGGSGDSLLSFSVAGDKLTISWGEPYRGQVLQSTISLLNPVWADVPGSPQSTSHVVSAAGPALFYRLVRSGGTSVEPAPPKLSLSPSGNGLVISWPAGAAGYRLEATEALLGARWETVPSSNNSAVVATTPASRFFRLSKP